MFDIRQTLTYLGYESYKIKNIFSRRGPAKSACIQIHGASDVSHGCTVFYWNSLAQLT